MCKTKQLLVPTDFDRKKKMEINGDQQLFGFTHILQNILFCVHHKNKNVKILKNSFLCLTEERNSFSSLLKGTATLRPLGDAMGTPPA